MRLPLHKPVFSNGITKVKSQNKTFNWQYLWSEQPASSIEI